MIALATIFLLLLAGPTAGVAAGASPVVYTSGESGYTLYLSSDSFSLEDHGQVLVGGVPSQAEVGGLPFQKVSGVGTSQNVLTLQSEFFCIVWAGRLITDPMINVSRRMPEIRPFGIYEGGFLRAADKASASSVLVENGKRYDPANLGLPFRNGPWVPSGHNNGHGQWVDLDFHNPYSIDSKESEVRRLLVVNGYVSADRPDLYRANSRAKVMVVSSVSPSFEIMTTLADSPAPQLILLPKPSRFVRVVIKEAYPGAKWADLCISMIWGITGLEQYFLP